MASTYSRRDLLKFGLLAAPAVGLLSRVNSLHAAAAATPQSPSAPTAKPNSKVNGVQIGLNVPYSFGGNTMDPEEVLTRCVALGVSGLELRSQPVELFLGVPPELVAGGRGGGRGAAPAAAPASGSAPAPAAAMTAEQRTAALAKWRLGVSMDKVKQFRKKYEDAGVLIEIVKFDGIYALTDEVLDYSFEMTRNLGARAVSCEISTSADDLKRLGRFADKHQIPVGYHGHTGVTPEIWEAAFAYAKFNWANVDLGHFVAGNNTSPVPFIKKHHDRITHVHVKDKKLNLGPNTPLGQGDTPIVEVLRLIRDNKWPIQATIEFEYTVPQGSDRMTEIAKCVKYCRDALVG